MKVRDSGMPDERLWDSFFDVEKILSELQCNETIHTLVEIGSGYGTFTIPASQKIKDRVYAFDIDSDMVLHLKAKLKDVHISNVVVQHRDVLEKTTGLEAESVDYVMLFNILHHERPAEFLNEAHRILKTDGKIGIIHWRSDVLTPRGPDLSIRPKSEDITAIIDNRLFRIGREATILEPYHFGLVVMKK